MRASHGPARRGRRTPAAPSRDAQREARCGVAGTWARRWVGRAWARKGACGRLYDGVVHVLSDRCAGGRLCAEMIRENRMFVLWSAFCASSFASSCSSCSCVTHADTPFTTLDFSSISFVDLYLFCLTLSSISSSSLLTNTVQYQNISEPLTCRYKPTKAPRFCRLLAQNIRSTLWFHPDKTAPKEGTVIRADRSYNQIKPPSPPPQQWSEASDSFWHHRLWAPHTLPPPDPRHKTKHPHRDKLDHTNPRPLPHPSRTRKQHND